MSLSCEGGSLLWKGILLLQEKLCAIFDSIAFRHPSELFTSAGADNVAFPLGHGSMPTELCGSKIDAAIKNAFVSTGDIMLYR